MTQDRNELLGIELIGRARGFSGRPAIIDDNRTHSYDDLLHASAASARDLLAGAADLEETRVAFMVGPGFDHVRVQWAIWRAGGIAVPLCLAHPRPELEYTIEDAGASIVVAAPEFAYVLRPIAEARGLRFHLTSDLSSGRPGEASGARESELPEVTSERRAMIIYTSGTTSRPKGVVSTHEMIAAQVAPMIEAWGWRPDDQLLHVLPLHHLHGILNCLCVPLWAGAAVEFMRKFKPELAWKRIASGGITTFMAVPTIYSKLVASWDRLPVAKREEGSAACRAMRLMVSGSAALPVQTLERWREISSHTLLERYGMTEIGMGLSNPLEGERRPGFVGLPMPGVEIRLVDDDGREPEPGDSGEILVRGPNVFSEYWGKPEATTEAFDDGWFKTGDIAVIENGAYRIQGRSSIDIIKTGGYKVSALEIEHALRDHEAIADCAVVGLPDAEWGELVAVAVVLEPGAGLTLEQLRPWAKERVAAYKAPTRLAVLEELPRNAMGKVTKPELIERLLADPP